MCSGPRPARCSAPAIATAPSSGALDPLNSPWNAPIGVRAALTRNASAIAMVPSCARSDSSACLVALAFGEYALDRVDDRHGAWVELDVDTVAHAFVAKQRPAQRFGD